MIDVNLLTQKEVSDTVDLHCFLCTRTSLFCFVYKNHWPLFHFLDPERNLEQYDFLDLIQLWIGGWTRWVLQRSLQSKLFYNAVRTPLIMLFWQFPWYDICCYHLTFPTPALIHFCWTPMLSLLRLTLMIVPRCCLCLLVTNPIEPHHILQYIRTPSRHQWHLLGSIYFLNSFTL